MTTRSFIEARGKGVRQGDILGSWNMGSGDVATPLLCPRYNDKSVQIFGTWGGATVSLQCTNDPALAAGSYQDAYDFEGTTISQTADRKPWVILPLVYALKPVITGGNGTTNLVIAIVGRGE